METEYQYFRHSLSNKEQQKNLKQSSRQEEYRYIYFRKPKFSSGASQLLLVAHANGGSPTVWN